MTRRPFTGQPDAQTVAVARRLASARSALERRKVEAAAEAARLNDLDVPDAVIAEWLGVARETVRAWHRRRAGG